MIEEDYVSFETAKLLKEKGFKTPVETGYYGDGRICHNLALDFMDYNHEDGYYSRPTIQMAMKWLREKHNLFIQITVDFSDGAYPMYDVYVVDLARSTSITINGYNRYSYKQACEAAIKYCLENLI